LFSAKGAQLNLQPGPTPQDALKLMTPALKARLTAIGREPRLQRLYH